MTSRPDFELHKINAIKSFADFSRGGAFPSTPLRMYLEITNYCNIRCAMCTQFSAISPVRTSVIQQKDRGIISVDDISANFSFLLDSVLQVICTGYGEPTIHPDFRGMIKYLSKRGVLISFITNAQLLADDLAEFLVEQGVYKIMVSCSGVTAGDYEKVYVGGKYDRLLRGLRQLRAAKERLGSPYPIVEVNSLGFVHHVAKFDEFVDVMSDHGASIIYLKTLQGFEGIPELFEHKAVVRPWIEGKILDRAVEIGRKRGVCVAIDPSLPRACSEADYLRLRGQLEGAAKNRLQHGKFGENPIDSFAAIAESIRASRAPRPQLKKIEPVPIAANDTPENVERLLNIQSLPEACASGSMYSCMEPFMTMYVYKDLGATPCCFGIAREHSLGSLKSEDGMAVWHGAGFAAVRDGVLAGRYSKSMCLNCLKNRLHPERHGAGLIVKEYAEWYSHRHGRDLMALLEKDIPDVLGLINTRDNDAIAAAQRLGSPSVATGEPAVSVAGGGEFAAWLEAFPRKKGFPRVSGGTPAPAGQAPGAAPLDIRSEVANGRALAARLLKLGADVSRPALILENRSGGLSYGLAESLVYPLAVFADPSEGFLTQLKAAFAPRPLDHDRLAYAILGVDETPLVPPGSLSLIVLRHRLNRMLDVGAFLSSCARALVPGGVLTFEEPFQEGLLLMGALARFIPAMAQASGIVVTEGQMAQINAFTETMKFYSRRDVDKSKAGVKHLFRPDELQAMCAKCGLDMEFHGNAGYATLGMSAASHPPHWFRLQFRSYVRNLMGFGEEFAQLFDATIAPYCDYIDEGSAGGRGPNVTGVCICRKKRPV